MEAHPPTYIEATTSIRKPWPLIAPYLTRKQLLANSLVCKSWHEIFAAQLWGNPASHYELIPSRSIDEGAQFFDLLRFGQSLDIAPDGVRRFTHTLHILPQSIAASTGTYSITSTTLPPTWLRDLVERLPKLQALILRGVSEVDHATLQAFAKPTLTEVQQRVARQSLLLELCSCLKLLDLSHCTQVTGKGLAVLLRKVPNLVWLDVSGTSACREIAVLESLQHLKNLKVLKMKGCKLDDSRVATLVHAIGRRVRWLDLENSGISPKALTHLQARSVSEWANVAQPEHDLNALPTYQNAISSSTTARLRNNPETLEMDIYRTLTSSITNRLSIEDEAITGITHLRLAQVELSTSYIMDLVTHPQLSYLSLIPCFIYHDHGHNPSSTYGTSMLRYLRLPYLLLEELLRDHIAPDGLPQYEETARSTFCKLFPELRTLVLTNVPSISLDQQDSPAIQAAAFIKGLLKTNALNAQEHRPNPFLTYSRRIELHTIVLEVGGPELERRNSSVRPSKPITNSPAIPPSSLASSIQSRGWNYDGKTKAVTGDADSEVLWRYAQESDFSFFDERENSIVQPSGRALHEHTRRPLDQISEFDLVKHLASFRRDAKKRYQEAVASMESLHRTGPVPYVEGYWHGNVKIVRV